MVEIIGSENLDTIVRDRTFTAGDNYLKKIVYYANRNFGTNRGKIDKICSILKNSFKNG